MMHNISAYYEQVDGLGGDFYWSRSCGDDVLIAIGDVEGNGKDSHVLAMHLIEITDDIHTNYNHNNPEESLADMMGRLNHFMYRNDKIADMLLGVINNGTFRYVSAGSMAPILVANNGSVQDLNDYAAGLYAPLGITETKEYELGESFEVKPGDKIVLTTDGVCGSSKDLYALVESIKSSDKGSEDIIDIARMISCNRNDLDRTAVVVELFESAKNCVHEYINLFTGVACKHCGEYK